MDIKQKIAPPATIREMMTTLSELRPEGSRSEAKLNVAVVIFRVVATVSGEFLTDVLVIFAVLVVPAIDSVTVVALVIVLLGAVVLVLLVAPVTFFILCDVV